MPGDSHFANDSTAQYVRRKSKFMEFKKQEIEQSIPSRFEQQVAKYPHKLALKTRTHQLSYTELNQLSNSIAGSILSARGVGAEPIVLLLEQGALLIASILGVLKAGKTYVPMDPTHPKSRLEYTLKDVQAGLIITANTNIVLCNKLTNNRAEVINVDNLDSCSSPVNPGLNLSPDTLAYIFYTSGSTGRPKGVVDNHRNVLHNIMRYTNSLHICFTDRITLLQSCSFSGSVSSLFSALLNGAAVFPYNIRENGLGVNLARWLIREDITVYHSVPMIFRSFLIGDLRFPSIRVIRLEGDAASKLDVELYKKHFESHCLLVNGLGATETGLTRQYFINKETELAQSITPIGHAVEDMNVLLLDDEDREIGFDCVGEIAIKSNYLSPGYWRNPELTQISFLSDPAGGNERIYKTGDMGRMLPDGCLEYLGRKDFELKVQGMRVEVAEVEAALLDLADIKEAVVSSREDHLGERQLWAYVVPAGNHAPNLGALRQALGEKLPDYMIPSAFVVLNSLPLNSNGKVDRSALPALDHLRIKAPMDFLAPRDSLEKQLTKIWEEFLCVSSIGIRDNFFELGGSSLLAAQMLARIQSRTGKTLSPSIFGEAATIERLANALRKSKNFPSESPLVAIRRSGSKPPLFCVHDLLGNTFFYADLARHLGPEQPFYGIQQVGGLRGPQDLPNTIHQMAGQYLVEIQKVQPKGPYFLGGFCFGGVVAFEMANQLHSQGRDVALLALFAVRPDDFPSLVSAKALRAYQRYTSIPESLKRKLLHLSGIGSRERLIYLRNLMSKIASIIKRDIASRLYYSIGRLWSTDQELYIKRMNRKAFEQYIPQTYPGRVILFSGEELTAAYSHDPLLDWKKLNKGELVIQRLPGEDHNMLCEPTVQIVAEQLQCYLRDEKERRDDQESKR